MCSLESMARFKDIVAGLSRQTARKSEVVAKTHDELNRLLEAHQRYEELSVWVGTESESTQIGMALLFGAPMKTKPHIDAYDLKGLGDAENDIQLDAAAMNLSRYPLWKIIREILRQVPEMRVYELEAHLKAFGVPKAQRSAIESAIKTHRKQFKVTKRGREKFVAWKENSNAAWSRNTNSTHK